MSKCGGSTSDQWIFFSHDSKKKQEDKKYQKDRELSNERSFCLSNICTSVYYYAKSKCSLRPIFLQVQQRFVAPWKRLRTLSRPCAANGLFVVYLSGDVIIGSQKPTTAGQTPPQNHWCPDQRTAIKLKLFI